METTKYLDMINSQIREARENMEIVEKSYKEAKAKHNALINSKESYLRWVMGDKELQYKEEA